MNTTISFDPDILSLDENFIAELLHAADVIGELYDVQNSELSLTLTNDENIHAMNKKFRNIDHPTDVLSFAFRESEEPKIIGTEFEILGDVIISIERAKSQAIEYGHSLLRELIFLEVHGLLHLLGYDHINDDERVEMESEQKFIMNRLGINR